MRAGRVGGGQQVTEDSIRDEIKGVSWDVPQDHGPSPSIKSLYSLCLQDGADAVDRASVELLVGKVDRAQGEVGASGDVTSQLEVLCQNHLCLHLQSDLDQVHWSAKAHRHQSGQHAGHGQVQHATRMPPVVVAILAYEPLSVAEEAKHN